MIPIRLMKYLIEKTSRTMSFHF